MTQSSPGAHAGIRVVDLSRILGGPYCGQILGDHGADVLKIEPPQGDDTRTWGPPFKDGVASYYFGLNRNKRVMRLDLTTPGGREVLLALVDKYRFGGLLEVADPAVFTLAPFNSDVRHVAKPFGGIPELRAAIDEMIRRLYTQEAA